MKIFKNALASGAMLAIPVLVEFPVLHAPAALPSGPASLPQDVLLARLAEAMRSAEPAAPVLGLVPALAVVGILLLISLWLVLRRRPIYKPERAPRERRATIALDLIRDGATLEEARVRAHVSRDAIELLRHTTMGPSFN